MYMCMDGWRLHINQKVNLYFKARIDFHQTWYVGSASHKCYPRGLLLPKWGYFDIYLNRSFAYLFSLAGNNKRKYPEFYIGYGNENWYVVHSSILLLSMLIFSTSFAYSDWLITTKSNIHVPYGLQ